MGENSTIQRDHSTVIQSLYAIEYSLGVIGKEVPGVGAFVEDFVMGV